MSINKKKYQHLFICYTPLHVLIAQKVIQIEAIQNFVLVFYYQNNTEKTKFYYNKLAQMADEVFYIQKINSPFYTLKTLFSIAYKLNALLIKNPKVYAGNIKTIYSRLLIFLVGAKKINSFDDGMGNVCGEGYFYDDIKPTLKTQFLSLIGLDFSYSKIYSKIKKHYTIYTTPNVMPNCYHINLFGFKDIDKVISENSKTTVLLVSTLQEENLFPLQQEIKLYQYLIDTFEVKYAIPHPLSKHERIFDLSVTIIKSDLIAEEIIMELKNKYKHIKLIGIYSSTLIHLANVDGIECINFELDYNVNLDVTKQFFKESNVKSFHSNVKFI